MKIIKKDGMIIEENDGIIFYGELLSRIYKSHKHNKKIRAERKIQAQKDKTLESNYKRQQAINKKLKPLKFNWLLFWILMIFWPAALVYVMIFQEIKRQRKL